MMTCQHPLLPHVDSSGRGCAPLPVGPGQMLTAEAGVNLGMSSLNVGDRIQLSITHPSLDELDPWPRASLG